MSASVPPTEPVRIAGPSPFVVLSLELQDAAIRLIKSKCRSRICEVRAAQTGDLVYQTMLDLESQVFREAWNEWLRVLGTVNWRPMILDGRLNAIVQTALAEIRHSRKDYDSQTRAIVDTFINDFRVETLFPKDA